MARFREALIKAINPALYMPLYETSNTPAITHLGTSSLGGTRVGTPSPGYMRTPIGNARPFALSLNENGSATDYLTISPMNFSGSSFIAGCLFRTTVSDSSVAYAGDLGQTILGDTSGTVWQNLGVHGDVLQLRRFNNSVWQDCVGTGKVTDGKWHLGIWTFDGPNADGFVYVDGALDGSNTSMTNALGAGGMPAITAIGRGFGGDYFQGQVAEVFAVTGVVATRGLASSLWQHVRKQLSGDRRDLR